MCGINGFNFNNEGLIKMMNLELKHRGPDGQSFFTDHKLSLGHARLSIIDLSKDGNQPMFFNFNNRHISIVFNGEIYNYIELRNYLLNAGYIFNTLSDTEVLMACYIEWGEKCVDKLNGMWSFCIYDIDNSILFCSRDRLGVKPFYYYYFNNLFIFSSELKAILNHRDLNINSFKNINIQAVELFFSMGFIPSPHSIYKNVYKLNAGSNLIYCLNKKMIINTYSFYEIPIVEKNYDRASLIKEGNAIMKDAVKLRMRSDVPVGSFLSGGLDSSTIVSEIKNFEEITNFHTFSIGFDEIKYDETYYINIVKDYFKTKHHHYTYKQDDFNQTWSKYSYIFDEPFGDYSAFPSYKVCKLASENVKVVLSGDGGDEIFGGYPIYNTGYILDKIYYLPIIIRKMLYSLFLLLKVKNNKLYKITELLRLSLFNKEDFYANLFAADRYKPEVYMKWSTEKFTKSLKLSNNNFSEALRIYDLLYNTLPDNYLVKVDRTSMANSIEVRSPFLDYRYIEFAQKIPNNLKINFNSNKILLRYIMKDKIPSKIIERDKMGFTPPIYEWLDESISNEDFKRYLGYLKDISNELYNFYNNLIYTSNKNYMFDLYRIKLAIFGKWFEYWILNEKQI